MLKQVYTASFEHHLWNLIVVKRDGQPKCMMLNLWLFLLIGHRHPPQTETHMATDLVEIQPKS